MLIKSITQNAMDKKFSIRQFPSPEHPYIAFPQKNLAVLDISRFTTGEIGPQSRLLCYHTGSVKQSEVTELPSSRCAVIFIASTPSFYVVLCYGTGFVVSVSLLDAVTLKARMQPSCRLFCMGSRFHI